MNQYIGTPKEWANTSNRWHIDAVFDIVLPISFGFHVEARRENVLLKKDLGENGGLPIILQRILLLLDTTAIFQNSDEKNSAI